MYSILSHTSLKIQWCFKKNSTPSVTNPLPFTIFRSFYHLQVRVFGIQTCFSLVKCDVPHFAWFLAFLSLWIPLLFRSLCVTEALNSRRRGRQFRRVESTGASPPPVNQHRCAAPAIGGLASSSLTPAPVSWGPRPQSRLAPMSPSPTSALGPHPPVQRWCERVGPCCKCRKPVIPSIFHRHSESTDSEHTKSRWKNF